MKSLHDSPTATWNYESRCAEFQSISIAWNRHRRRRFPGVRPSSGAAMFVRQTAFDISRDVWLEHVAAPEDGRTSERWVVAWPRCAVSRISNQHGLGECRTVCRLEVGDTAGWKPALQPFRFMERPIAAFLLGLTLLAVPVLCAEDGYELWLRYRKVDDPSRRAQYRDAIGHVVVPGENATSEIIRSEFQRALPALLDT